MYLCPFYQWNIMIDFYLNKKIINSKSKNSEYLNTS